MKPDFSVIGAAKAGTIWLYYCLEGHHQMFVSIPRELNLFSEDDVYSQGYE